ncbi:NUMOD4 domain-containing protein [Chryseobacterium vrystaatense]|uniref:NUMOD4 motif-containing protein n=1 Tax=Chryseobacterium vrystaatense TaxID=307480 RepID=A0A1M4ZJG2_9FLAO|nr:NUMOD4 domain-containing protein [Chryseobacterium vrystaatense]SHF17947.1 NUMOD4 motif-containing protein [Chryseobacterium vrystaatense]
MNETVIIDLKDLPGEIWKEISEYKGGYMVSNFGRVKSFIRTRPIILKKTITSGRHFIKIALGRGRYKNEEVGRLVAKVFIRMPEENEILKPIDGNFLNNAASNLEWTSRQYSASIAKGREGFSQKGTRNGMARLNEDKAREIRNLKASGKTYSSIAQKYDVSISCIQYVVQNKCWK